MLKRHHKSPEAIIGRKQFYTIGCGGCAGSQKSKGKWTCDKGESEYPNMTKHTCSWWREKKGK